jgi:hypothetical protein
MSDAASTTLVGVVCPIRNVAGTPTAGTPVQIQSTGSLRGAGRALLRGGFLFFSFDTATQDPQKAYPTADGSDLWTPPSETWRSWLQVVDLRPASPVVRDPVSIPGELLSVDQVDAQGAVLVTHKERWIASRSSNERTLNALAYDGAAASLLDTLDTTSPYGSASASDGTRIFLANASSTPGVLAIGYNAASGRLLETGQWNLKTPISLHTVGGYVFAANTGTLDLAEVNAAGQFAPRGSYATPTNLWLQLDRIAMAVGEGIYIPAGAYGVESLPWKALSAYKR